MFVRVVTNMLSTSKLRELKSSPPSASGNRIAKATELLGMTQTQVAASLGFTGSYLSDVVRGRYPDIGLTNARKLSDFFGCAIEDLFPPAEPVTAADRRNGERRDGERRDGDRRTEA